MTDTPDMFSPVVYQPFAGRPDDDDTLDMTNVSIMPLQPRPFSLTLKDLHAMRTTDFVPVTGIQGSRLLGKDMSVSNV